MPAKWTGKLIGEMHNHGVTGKQLADELGWHEKYLSRVLNCENPPRRAEQSTTEALRNILSRRNKPQFTQPK